MTFAEPGFLFLLPLVPVLGVLAFWWERKREARLAQLSRHARQVKPALGKRARAQVVLLLGAGLMLVLALAGPRWGQSTEELVTRARNVMIAVDVSRSMLAQDVRPDRLGRAKADVTDLIDALKGDRAGLLAFRGKGVLLCPMTTDLAFLRQSVDALSPESAPPGETDLADAISKCLEAFDRAQSSHNAIVLISDGEDLAGRATELAKTAGKRGVPIFTVGIGSTRGAPIPDKGGTVQFEGKSVQSRLTESTLKAIAEQSGGHYIPLATAGTAQTTLGAVYSRYLARLADQEARERLEVASTDRTALFSTLSVLFALGALLLSAGRISRPSALVLFLALAPVLRAVEPAREGQHAYRRGDYAQAATHYAEARAGAEPSELAHYAYNEALALWKAGDATNALERIRQAVDDRAFTSRAATLEGTLLLAQAADEVDPVRKLALREDALAAFTRALQAEPSDVAQRNLSRAQEGLDALRREARRASALAQFKGQALGQLVPKLLTSQRALAQAVPEVFSSPTPSVRLSLAQQLAKDVRTQSDRWFPVVEALPQAITNETLRAELTTRANEAQARLDAAADAYEALTGDARLLLDGEPFVYDLWKTFADPPALNAESIAVQTNALTRLTRYQPARDDEEEVLALTQQFRLLFPQWAEEQLQQQAASTNAVTFTEADRDLIARTADATVPLLAPPVSPANKQKVMENLLLIREHLPKQNQNSSAQQNPQESPQNQEQNPQPQQDNAEKPQGEPKPQPSAGEEKDKKDDIKALLQKAADRQRELEEEKKRRARLALPPTTRDW